ncbi:MAG: GNAT family N-acetyltransferase [Nocardioidaceae bacterium]
MSNVTIRPLAEGEISQFLSYDQPPVPGVGVEAQRSYVEMIERNEYRPGWIWVAERDGRVVARAAWWAGPDDARPWSLDWLDPGVEPDAVEIGARLVAAGLAKIRDSDDSGSPVGETPQMHLFLPVGWRDIPAARAAADSRLAAAEAGGFTPFIERFGYRWARSDGLPASSGRLTFRQVPDDDELVEVLRRVLVGTFDGHSQHDIEEHGLEKAAELQLEGLRWFPSPREWWRLGLTADGDVAGLIVPARNYMMPTIGYLGVVPEQRGHGYVGDLLAEQTRFLASVMGPDEEIGADTDFGNAPMAAAFARAGFRHTQTRIVLTA